LEVGYSIARAAVQLDIADILIRQRKYDEALEILKVLQASQDQLFKSTVFQRMALISEMKEKYDEALEILETKVLPIAEKLGNLENKYSSYFHIANIYRSKGEYDEALEILETKVLPIAAKDLANPSAVAETLYGLANVFYDRGEYDDYDKALEFLDKRLSYEEQTGNQPGIGITLASKGKVLIKKSRYEDALQSTLRAYIILKRTNLTRDATEALNNLHSIQKNLDY
jgi:tetratricopeptide (TPR) repeat protein